METITTLKHETVEALQDLIEINIDSSKGFATAAESVDDPRLSSLFRECGRERERFADELKYFVAVNNERPEDSGSVKGTIHRWWLSVRGAVQDGNPHAILEEAERGEDSIKHTYEKLLRETAGSAVNDVLQKQYTSVKARHDQIRDMRDASAS